MDCLEDAVEADPYFQSKIWSKWELLAAMQALAIYIITRLNEGETEHNGLDSLLIASVTVSIDKNIC